MSYAYTEVVILINIKQLYMQKRRMNYYHYYVITILVTTALTLTAGKHRPVMSIQRKIFIIYVVIFIIITMLVTTALTYY